MLPLWQRELLLSLLLAMPRAICIIAKLHLRLPMADKSTIAPLATSPHYHAPPPLCHWLCPLVSCGAWHFKRPSAWPSDNEFRIRKLLNFMWHFIKWGRGSCRWSSNCCCCCKPDNDSNIANCWQWRKLLQQNKEKRAGRAHTWGWGAQQARQFAYILRLYFKGYLQTKFQISTSTSYWVPWG